MSNPITEGFTTMTDNSQPMKSKPDFEGSFLHPLSADMMAEVEAKTKAALLDQTKDYGEPDYLLYQGEVGFMSRGDMQAIKAQQKNGKSMLMDIFMGTILKGKYGCLRCPYEDMKVLYIDTEQHERNTSLQSKRVHTICGWHVYEFHENFQILTLRGESLEMSRMIVEYQIKTFKPDAVFIDGIRDLCADFNDLKETANLIKWEMNMSKIYNLALCSVLHVNPNSDKMRGHLGTEEQNKCSDVFTVIKNKKENGSVVFFKVKQTDARNRDIEDFEFECQGTYGTPVIRCANISSEVAMSVTTYTTTRYSKPTSNITISFNQKQLRDILIAAKNLLIVEAKTFKEFIKLLKESIPLMDLTLDGAAAFTDYCIKESYITETRGKQNSRLLRWNPSAVIPMQETEEPTESPF